MTHRGPFQPLLICVSETWTFALGWYSSGRPTPTCITNMGKHQKGHNLPKVPERNRKISQLSGLTTLFTGVSSASSHIDLQTL